MDLDRLRGGIRDATPRVCLVLELTGVIQSVLEHRGPSAFAGFQRAQCLHRGLTVAGVEIGAAQIKLTNYPLGAAATCSSAFRR